MRLKQYGEDSKDTRGRMTRSMEMAGGGTVVRGRYHNGGPGMQQSRLEMLQADYQKKLLKEKEEKMLHLYEENQQRALNKVNSRQTGSGFSRGGSVREFFKERRALGAQGKGDVPPIHQHYTQYQNSPSGSAKTYNSSLSRNSTLSYNSTASHKSSSSGPQGYRNSAGRDRSNPLAPIDQKAGSRSPQNNQVSRRAPVPPIQQKPRIYQRKPTGGKPDSDKNGNRIYHGQIYSGYDGSPTDQGYLESDSDNSPPHGTKYLRTSKQRRPMGGAGDQSSSPEKMTDFQKWQMAQNQARDDRLQRHKQEQLKSRTGYGSEREDVDSGVDLNDEIRRKQDELQARLDAEKAELQKLQNQRQQKEDKERQRKARQERAERERQKRMEEQRERQRAAEEERQRLQEERRRAEEERLEGERQREAQMTQRSRGRKEPEEEYNSTPRYKPAPRKSPPKTQKAATKHQRQRTPPHYHDDEEDIPVPGPSIDIYAEAANGRDAFGPKVDLAECKVCGRRFAKDRIMKHQKACKTVAKPRKKFDPVKMRTEGTEAAQYVRQNKHKKEPPVSKKKSNWRAQHESFIQSIRYAKKMSEYEASGGKLSDLPPPPPSDTSDYVQCPHCNRRFNQTVAERHIPKCVNIRAKPRPPPNKRR